MTPEEIQVGQRVIWMQRVYGSPELHRVAATVRKVGRLVLIEGRDTKGERFMRHVEPETLRAK